MEHFTYKTDENVAIVTMDSGENRFNYEFFEQFHKLLDELEQKDNLNVLVVKSSHEKIWSNGIDLEWIAKNMEKDGPGFFEEFAVEMYRLFNRILTYPMITFAAITGHAFAGGAIMSCAFDYRYMRDDRGWFCFPEIDIKIPFTPFLNAIALKAIPVRKLNQMQLTGERLTAEECLKADIIQKICTLDSMIPEVLEYAKTLVKDKEMIKKMKAELFSEIVQVCKDELAKHNKSL